MFVITFYSYKGGVGRTMALVNVAAELVQRGRKVLVVDFDVEAPGLETYKRLRPPQPHPGVVEYVTQFMRTHHSPDVKDFLYEVKPIGEKGGRMWVMPAGRRDSAYRQALINLSWKKLYHDCQGFVFFEDTRKQWEEELDLDYVLIDSRTGETDVLGICTRQLPDSVVLLFIPNEQNLAGLEHVCSTIRREEHEGMKKEIPLHFVAANVPLLDDEGRTLRRHLRTFRERLQFEELACIIHRKNTLTLLDQRIFVLERPRSRLAREYRQLAGALTKGNLADRDVVLQLLQRREQELRSRMDDPRQRDQEAILTTIQRKRIDLDVVQSIIDKVREGNKNEENTIISTFLADPEVLVKVAQCRALEGRPEDALGLLDAVIRLREDHPLGLWERAQCSTRLGNSAGAGADLLAYLRTPNLNKDVVLAALEQLRLAAPRSLPDAFDLPSVHNLDSLDRIRACRILGATEKGLPRAINILQSADLAWPIILSNIGGGGETHVALLVFYLLRSRRWREVIDLLEQNKERTERGSPASCWTSDFADFNLAMAYWGETGQLDEELCKRVDEADGWMRSETTQAIPLVLWRLGEGDQAVAELDRTIAACKDWRLPEFSYWQYREVSPAQFLADCKQLRRMIQGEELRPEFLGPAPERGP